MILVTDCMLILGGDWVTVCVLRWFILLCDVIFEFIDECKNECLQEQVDIFLTVALRTGFELYMNG